MRARLDDFDLRAGKGGREQKCSRMTGPRSVPVTGSASEVFRKVAYRRLEHGARRAGGRAGQGDPGQRRGVLPVLAQRLPVRGIRVDVERGEMAEKTMGEGAKRGEVKIAGRQGPGRARTESVGNKNRTSVCGRSKRTSIANV